MAKRTQSSEPFTADQLDIMIQASRAILQLAAEITGSVAVMPELTDSQAKKLSREVWGFLPRDERRRVLTAAGMKLFVNDGSVVRMEMIGKSIKIDPATGEPEMPLDWKENAIEAFSTIIQRRKEILHEMRAALLAENTEVALKLAHEMVGIDDTAISRHNWAKRTIKVANDAMEGSKQS